MIPVDQIAQGFIAVAVVGMIYYGLVPMLCGTIEWIFDIGGMRTRKGRG